jgi:hypothetical protein
MNGGHATVQIVCLNEELGLSSSQDETPTFFIGFGFQSLPSLPHPGSVLAGNAYGGGAFSQRHRKRREDS